MKNEYLTKDPFSPSIRLKLKHAATLIIAFTVMASSPLLILDSPALASTSLSSPRSSTGPNESGGPSTISQGGDFTAQAPLQIPRTLQSTDLVNSLAFYEVTFITATTGVIDKIEMEFPAGTNIAAGGVIERVGIGGGTLTKVGSTLTFDVTSPVSIPAGTFIRLEMFGIQNPDTPSSTFTATLTTRDSGGATIDGPSTTNLYTIKQVGTDDIADNAITTPKISDDTITTDKVASSFAYKRVLADGESGWNPDGTAINFPISDTLFDVAEAVVVVNLDGDSTAPIATCAVSNLTFESFVVTCTSAPPNGAELRYAVFVPAEPPAGP
jgi:hypothetical protein